VVLEPSARFLVSFDTLTSFGDAIGLVTAVAVTVHKPTDSVTNIFTLKQFQVDLIIYHLAMPTSQDTDYRESLTGEKPSYLIISPSDIQGRGNINTR
jgi:predicted PP-loop superfamily ATPase